MNDQPSVAKKMNQFTASAILGSMNSDDNNNNNNNNNNRTYLDSHIECNNVTKIHCNSPTKYLHAIIDRESGLHICLSINNAFSVFPSTKPTIDDVHDTDIPLVLISPEGSWDPSSSPY